MKKLLVIFGRNGCPACVSAKDLAKQMVNNGTVTDYDYREQSETNWTKEDIAKLFNIDIDKIQTIPQIGLITTNEEGNKEGEKKVTYIGGYNQLSTISL